MNKYWKKKFKNEYGVYVKTITILDDYDFNKVYIAYTKDENDFGRKELEICDRIFKSPQEIDKYFKGRR